jgi:hypothetical protein
MSRLDYEWYTFGKKILSLYALVACTTGLKKKYTNQTVNTSESYAHFLVTISANHKDVKAHYKHYYSNRDH